MLLNQSNDIYSNHHKAHNKNKIKTTQITDLRVITVAEILFNADYSHFINIFTIYGDRIQTFHNKIL